MLKEDLGEGEIWFFHLVIGDGVFANERACRIVLAKVPPRGKENMNIPRPSVHPAGPLMNTRSESSFQGSPGSPDCLIDESPQRIRGVRGGRQMIYFNNYYRTNSRSSPHGCVHPLSPLPPPPQII